MPVSLQTFTNFAAARSAGSSRSFHVRQQGADTVAGATSFKQRLGLNLEANKRTMQAFRACLSERYGVFGEHAFDAVLGVRSDTGKTLRAKDITSVMRALEPGKGGVVRDKMLFSRFDDEVTRQCETNPRVIAANVSQDVKARLTELVRLSDTMKAELRACSNSDELARLVDKKINVLLDLNLDPASRRPLRQNAPAAAAAAPAPGQDVPHGLRSLDDGVTFGRKETSVEDRVRSGAFGAGMRVNENGVKFVFEKLKTSGVEPGFIARRDWTAADTAEMMRDGSELDGLARRVLAERILHRGLGGGDDVAALKTKHFVAIRDAVLGGLGSVKRLTERHIVKLDYNENDRTRRRDAAHVGSFRLPVRNSIKGGAVKGAFFRAFRLTTADKASAGAVAEALANDLTRAMGVPTQELSLVRGEYSDGHEKFMLVSKFASGYHDFDGNFLKDGRLVGRQDANGNVVEQPEDIGRYKAMFLLLADRDAVGSHGQNKGIVGGRFFAIDPGHSLEGNGSALDIRDDFSFRDTKASPLEKRFMNFSVFDDSNRSEKLKGMVALRDACVRGDFDGIFREYETRFDPAAATNAAQRKLREAICARIGEMKAEFTAQYDRMAAIFDGQLKVYDHFKSLANGDDATACKVIDAVENLERLTSPTVSTSKHGEVALRHLEVVPETRVPWRAEVAEDGSVRFSSGALPEEKQRKVGNLVDGAGATEIAYGAKADGMRFTVPADQVEAFLASFTEAAVRTVVSGQ